MSICNMYDMLDDSVSYNKSGSYIIASLTFVITMDVRSVIRVSGTSMTKYVHCEGLPRYS